MIAPGARLGRYVVEARVGQGGMAEVWRVLDDIGTPFALKVLTNGRDEARQRFRAEAEIQKKLVHRNIVRAVEVLEIGDEPGLVMEYVPGRALDGWLAQHRDASRQTRDVIARQVIEAVDHAHRQGLIHRDLKPANVLLLETPDGPVPKVTDFGLAKQLGQGLAATRTGVALGTPRYMAPEQIRDAKRVDARADLWSLGALLYELYTGRPAFHRDTLVDIFSAVITADYEDPAAYGVTGSAREAIVGCLKVEPAERFQDCSALLAALFAPEPMPAPAVAPAPPIPTAPTLLPLSLPPDDEPPVRVRPRRVFNRWTATWLAALVVVVLAFVVGMSIVGGVWLAGEVASEPPREAPRPAPMPERPRRRR